MRITLLIPFLLLAFLSSQSQFLIENNNADEKARQKVKSETGYYQMPDGSTCLMWVKEFNRQGLMTLYKDHWQCGEPYWTYQYKYNKAGTCIASVKRSYKDGFKPVRMKHVFNDDKQLIQRSATDLERYPMVEDYEYDSLGNIVTVTFSGPEKNGEKHPWTKSWNGEQNYKITASEKVSDENQKLKWTVIREYDFYE